MIYVEFWSRKLIPSQSIVRKLIFSKKRYFVILDFKIGDISYYYCSKRYYDVFLMCVVRLRKVGMNFTL